MTLLPAIFAIALVQPHQDLPPLFRGTGVHTRRVTPNAQAQKYFDQGLNMLYAFHHGESKRSFRAAIKIDPKCAMAYWGLATANGPHINNMAVDRADEKEAYDAVKKAVLLINGAKPADRSLIRAAQVRFAHPQPKDRSPLDRAYAFQMREVWRKHPNDADVGALYAESMADLRPWDLWTPAGQPQPGTQEIVRTLERVLEMNPRHPFALHLYIHAVEASPNPERAIDEADRLRTLQPGLGHNVHMPSHIDVRVGSWQKAIESNARAMRVDADYRSEHTPAPIYRMYMAHNNHMLAFAAMMSGQSKLAIQSIDSMVAAVPEEFQKEAAPFIDGFFAMPAEVRVRFGKWDEVLQLPEVPDHFPISKALRHASRAIAHAAKGNPISARQEQTLFYMFRRDVPAEAVFGNNKAHDLLVVATHLMNGEILIAEDKVDEAIATLKLGIAAEDKLRYSEPPDWIQPVRHTLGALLVREKMFDEAEIVYNEDLERLPRNGWGLLGLAVSLAPQGRLNEAGIARREFDAVWKRADIQIDSSCLCVPKK